MLTVMANRVVTMTLCANLRAAASLLAVKATKMEHSQSIARLTKIRRCKLVIYIVLPCWQVKPMLHPEGLLREHAMVSQTFRVYLFFSRAALPAGRTAHKS